jgi:hypothetical protein
LALAFALLQHILLHPGEFVNQAHSEVSRIQFLVRSNASLKPVIPPQMRLHKVKPQVFSSSFSSASGAFGESVT